MVKIWKECLVHAVAIVVTRKVLKANQIDA